LEDVADIVINKVESGLSQIGPKASELKEKIKSKPWAQKLMSKFGKKDQNRGGSIMEDADVNPYAKQEEKVEAVIQA
jgi:hypothetical protein